MVPGASCFEARCLECVAAEGVLGTEGLSWAPEQVIKDVVSWMDARRELASDGWWIVKRLEDGSCSNSSKSRG
jgi:hypothetical protein